MSYIELDDFKRDLAIQYDFSFYDAYTAIDIYETRFIDFSLLKKFFKSCGKIIKEDDLIPILRRIDRDDDGKVSYEEFVEAIKPQKAVIKNDKNHFSTRSKTMKSPSNRMNSVNTYQAIIDNRSPTRLKSPTRVKSPSRTLASPNYELYKGIISPKNGFLSTSKGFKESLEYSPRDDGRFSEKMPIRVSRNSLRNKDIETKTEIIKVFREIIHLEREIELSKQDLALRSDYNVFDTFRLFDKKGKSILSVGDIEEGFNDLGIFPNKEELYLFIRRFDKDADGKLRYKPFNKLYFLSTLSMIRSFSFSILPNE